jgi:hypothetical protein
MKTNLRTFASLLIIIGLSSLTTLAQVPGILDHQGKIIVNGTNYTGTGQFKFALVNAAGNITYWSNDGSSTAGAEPTSAVSLPVARGIFSVNLGDTSVANMTQTIPAAAFTNSGVYLRVWFNDGVDGSQLLSPDKQLTTVGYAFQAASALAYNETDPVYSASIASGITGTLTNNWNTAFSWGNHATAGYLTQTTADARYALISSVYTKAQSDAKYLTGYTETDPIFSASIAAGIQASETNAWNNKIGGAGTTGVIPEFTASGTISNSVIVQSSGKIGIGTNTPGQTLSVNGKIQSATGGFMFPDGTVQTTAATNTTSSGGGGSSSVLTEAFLSTDLSLTANSLVQLPFGTSTINVGNALSGGTFTVPATGNYIIQCTVVSTNTPGHIAMINIFNNGAFFYAGPTASGIATAPAIPYGYVATANFTGPLTAGSLLTFDVAVNVAGVTASSGSSLTKTSLLITKLP